MSTSRSDALCWNKENPVISFLYLLSRRTPIKSYEIFFVNVKSVILLTFTNL